MRLTGSTIGQSLRSRPRALPRYCFAKKAPKRWADNVDTTGSFCQMAHFDGGYRSAVSGGIASVHTLMLDLDCLEGGVTADGQKCRRWPTEGSGVSVPTTS